VLRQGTLAAPDVAKLFIVFIAAELPSGAANGAAKHADRCPIWPVQRLLAGSDFYRLAQSDVYHELAQMADPGCKARPVQDHESSSEARPRSRSMAELTKNVHASQRETLPSIDRP